MAPKNKFTKEEMVAAAVRVVQEKGMDGLTAKTLAEELGVSTQPVFTCFSTMDAVKKEVRAAAQRMYDTYVVWGLQERVPLFGYGMQYIQFAREEPELYRLLFLTPSAGGEDGVLESVRHAKALALPVIMQVYKMDEADAERYFQSLWLVVHSLATLLVTGACPYSDEEIGRFLTGFSVSICMAIKEIPGFTAVTFDRNAVFGRLLAEKETEK